MKNRLKSAVSESQLRDRLVHEPEILELHLVEEDLFGEKLNVLQRTIQNLQSLNITVYLHHPMKHKGKLLDILHKEQYMRNFYQDSTRILYEVCKQYNIKCVLHCHYSGTGSSNYQNLEKTLLLKKEIEAILSWSENVFLWENTIHGLFAYHNPYLLETVIEPLHLPIVHDISHTFIGVKGNNEKLYAIAKELDPYVRYLHVVDSLGKEHDGLELGKGLINWKPLLPYIKDKPFIFEIALENQEDSTPQVRSNVYFQSLLSSGE